MINLSSDQLYCIKIGLLIGQTYPSLAEKMLRHETLGPVAEDINKELGTTIKKGMLLEDVWDQVHDAITRGL